MIKQLKQRIDNRIQEFISQEQSAGFLIIGATALALILGNLPVHVFIEKFWHIPASLEIGEFRFSLPLHAWVNDGLMAIFFFMVGLEIKREMIEGELSTFKKASLPVFAALGGMIVPATIYVLFNFNNPETAHGWGVPMATDIAFALAVLLLAGDRVPFVLKLMLTSLAVVDDLGAIIVIALFYTESLQLNYLLAAGAITLWLSLMNYAGVKRFIWYLIPGILLWYFIFQSGVHATIAGVLFAMTIPHNKHKSSESTLLSVVHGIHIPVNFFILPIFAFNNTLITFTPEMFKDLASPMALGVSLGLILGKPIGITLFVWLAITTGISTLGKNISLKHIFSVSILGGIGFTMSIFISLLAFKDADMINAAKLAILISSILAAIIGLVVVKSVLATTTKAHK